MSSSDQPARPCSGTAAGVPYVALPPTAIDVEPDGPTRLIVAWHGFEPPRSEGSFAAAVPMTGVPAWRVYLGLPMFGNRLPAGGIGEVRARAQHDYLVDLYGPVAQQAAAELPAAVTEIRDDLGLANIPIGLVGFSAGGGAALLALAEGNIEVAAAALIAPIAAPALVLAAMERRSGGTYTWTDESRALAARLDFTSRAREVVARDPALMLFAGGNDDLVTESDLAGLRDLLTAAGGTRVEALTFSMAHALAAEPGLAAEPPIAEAVSVDAALTGWFRDRFGVKPHETPPTVPFSQTPAYDPRPRLRAGSWTTAAPTLSSR
ncbi:MAG: alpha/beta hydrolase [Streptosporangiaceae bacterium]|jgi:dienelactone hydrolase|nr:alpha/beta hydrolase [Streptosporangiaceae bacterium]